MKPSSSRGIYRRSIGLVHRFPIRQLGNDKYSDFYLNVIAIPTSFGYSTNNVGATSVALFMSIAMTGNPSSNKFTPTISVMVISSWEISSV